MLTVTLGAPMAFDPTVRMSLREAGFSVAEHLANELLDESLQAVSDRDLWQFVAHKLWLELGEPGEFGTFADDLVAKVSPLRDVGTFDASDAAVECANPVDRIYPAAELADRDYPPLVQYVEGLVVEGLTVLGGKPKLGKSWLVLNLAVAVANGEVALGSTDRSVTRTGVVYLALEDGERRMKGRLGMIGIDSPPENLYLVHEWPRLDSGGLDHLRNALDRLPDVGVVVIDTLGRVRGPRKRGDWYGEDYEVLGALHDLARARPGLAIIVVHHNRKDDSTADYVDALSGSTGIGGSPDVVIVLQRGRGEVGGVLNITGRDIAEDERALLFAQGLWTEVGSATDFQRTRERREVLALFDDPTVATSENSHRVLTASAVSAALGITPEAARQRLSRSERDGELWKPALGKYARPETPSQTSHSHKEDGEENDERDTVTDVTGFGKTGDRSTRAQETPDTPQVSEQEALNNIMETFPGADVVE